MIKNGFLILLFAFTLISCVPQDSLRNTSDQATEDNSTGNPTTTIINGSLHFVNNAQNVSEIVLPSTYNDVLYLRGSAITNLFSQQPNILSMQYCLVMNFENIIINPTLGTIGNRQLRIRAIPSSYFDFTQQATVQVLRLDFNAQVASTAACSGVFGAYDSSIPSQVFFSTSTLCPLCNSTINADNLYLANSISNAVAADTLLISQSSELSIDIAHESSSSGGGSVACNQSTCTGADYCCDNETALCVQHKSPKPYSQNNPYSTEPQYQVALDSALADILSVPSNITNYPHLFYLCPGQPTGGSGGGGNNDGGAVVTQIQFDYACAEEIRENAFGSPYQQFLNTSPTSCDPLTPGSCECKYGAADINDPLYYITVLERLYDYCGCQGANASQKFTNCNPFYYEVLASNTFGDPIQFQCSAITTPGFDPNIALNSKSVPHRFYSQAGASIDDLTTAPSGTVQEGVEFNYIDPGVYIYPLSSSFNMNAILGSQKIDLSGARPAQITTVEQGQTYIIRNTGTTYYIPCPTCPTDSWLPTFRPWPNSITQGLGLQAYGHTTRRDSNEFNNNLGNFEDNIWGRACFIPPTMIPFSQRASGLADVNDSRTKRLETQAAMFVNGYQRDWFGFNKGAVIGSFDGVSWFAIGKNRLVEAKSNKLFLAINAPFGDLATPSIHNLTIESYIPGSQASEYDYNPNLPASSIYAEQNMGGSCQRYHMCETDTDCVTQLGWEYVCAEATARKTYWPTFNNANEVLSPTPSPKGIVGILQQDSIPTSTTSKRCVYRGAGSPCVQNPNHVFNEQLRRSLTCAPNFYCANTSLPVFNEEVSRYAAPLGDINYVPNNHIYGFDANILGRPLHYQLGSGLLVSLPTSVAQAIKDNILANNTLVTTKVSPAVQVGLCRPGRATLPNSTFINTTSHSTTTSTLTAYAAADPVLSHKMYDSASGSDYISQIGTANKNIFNSMKYLSCPVMGDEGDYLHLEQAMVDKYTSSNAHTVMQDFITKSVAQNITGGETKNFSNSSPFQTIEAGKLDSGNLITTPTLVENACLRRAGAACHTDLDCSPGRLHKSIADLFDVSYFGNPAEQAFWNESLVCGQATPKPSPGLTTFDTYDIRKNRCCREVGSDMTIFSANAPETTFSLDTKKPGYAFPTSANRYSRLMSVDLNNDGLFEGGDKALDASFIKEPSGIIAVLQGNMQWKTIHDVASRTCCGGGWVRKFSNNTHNWANPVQAQFSTQDFACLNYITPFVNFPANELFDLYGIPLDITNTQRNFLCEGVNPTDPECSQVPFSQDELDNYDETSPIKLKVGEVNPLNDHSADFIEHKAFRICSAPVTGGGCDNGLTGTEIGPLTPYRPKRETIMYNWFDPQAIDVTNGLFQQIDTDIVTEIRFKIPSYIPLNNIPVITGISGGMTNSNNDNSRGLWNFTVDLIDESNSSPYTCGTVNTADISSAAPTPTPDCWFSIDANSGLLKVALQTTGVVFPSLYTAPKKKYAARISFLPPSIYEYSHGGAAITPVFRGSPYHYLKRLARIELAGIPQIHHEPLYCSDNMNKLIPGIYRSSFYNSTGENYPDSFSGSNVVQPDAPVSTYDYADQVQEAIHIESPPSSDNLRRVTNYKDLATTPIFSENEFTCCQKLGSYVSTASQCCSGYVVSDYNQTPAIHQCRLPAKTDVNLYFNKFVSGEGAGPELEAVGIALAENDFDPNTGEPKVDQATTVTKLKALAANYCDSNEWRFGGAFGNFIGEPNVTAQIDYKFFSIVDSTQDVDDQTVNNSSEGSAKNGFGAFSAGYKWNHHIYCRDPNDGL